MQGSFTASSSECQWRQCSWSRIRVDKTRSSFVTTQTQAGRRGILPFHMQLRPKLQLHCHSHNIASVRLLWNWVSSRWTFYIAAVWQSCQLARPCGRTSKLKIILHVMQRIVRMPYVWDRADTRCQTKWRHTNDSSMLRKEQWSASNKQEDGAEDTSAEELEEQTASDRVLLKLFQDALKAGRLQRAQEVAACLHLQRSLEGALKLTNLHRWALSEACNCARKPLDKIHHYMLWTCNQCLWSVLVEWIFPSDEELDPSLSPKWWCLLVKKIELAFCEVSSLRRIPVLAQAITRLIAGREEEAAQQEGKTLFSTPQTAMESLHSQQATPHSGQEVSHASLPQEALQSSMTK